MKNILFVADPLASFHPAKDSTILLMEAAQNLGYRVLHCCATDLFWQISMQAKVTHVSNIVVGAKATWDENPYANIQLLECEQIHWRMDPPITEAYSQQLQFCQNAPYNWLNPIPALLSHNEKLSTLQFSEFTPISLVSANFEKIVDFAKTHKTTVLKPLNAMGGQGVFQLRESDPNFLSIIRAALNVYPLLLVQMLVPEYVHGDLRVFAIHNRVHPVGILRVPQNNSALGNLAAGGKAIATEVPPKILARAQHVLKTLAPQNLYFVGLDFLGDTLTEINITSPTCLRELYAQTGENLALEIIKNGTKYLNHGL